MPRRHARAVKGKHTPKRKTHRDYNPKRKTARDHNPKYDRKH